MTDDDQASDAPTPGETPDPPSEISPAGTGADPTLVCKVCGEVAKTAQGRASHERGKHGVKSDKAPTSVKIQVGADRKSVKDKPELERLEAKAKQWCEMAAVGLVLMGQGPDAIDVQRMADEWAKAVKNVGRHEEWLRKLAEGGESSERVIAWVQLLMVSGTMLAPILIRHHALPAPLAEVLAQVMSIPLPRETIGPDGHDPLGAPVAA
jgi:hypothetical protein